MSLNPYCLLASTNDGNGVCTIEDVDGIDSHGDVDTFGANNNAIDSVDDAIITNGTDNCSNDDDDVDYDDYSNRSTIMHSAQLLIQEEEKQEDCCSRPSSSNRSIDSPDKNHGRLLKRRTCHRHNRRRTESMTLTTTSTILLAAPLLLLVPFPPPLPTLLPSLSLPTAEAFAAWFVDRRVSCFTDLSEDEIIMNNKVVGWEDSREKGIRVEVSPRGNDYAAKFVVPSGAKVMDVQYILELSNGGDGGDSDKSGASDETEPLAKFTFPPNNGGIGCEGRRSHGKAGSADAPAVFTLSENAKRGDRVEVWGGWATGHEAVTLTEKVVILVGEGIVGAGGAGANDATVTAERKLEKLDKPEGEDAGDNLDYADDLSYKDDELESEREEQVIERERKELEEEVEEAEEDAIRALEEKRLESVKRVEEGDFGDASNSAGGGGLDSLNDLNMENEEQELAELANMNQNINEAEEEIVEALEENRNDMNQALNSLKDEIISRKTEREKENASDAANRKHEEERKKRKEEIRNDMRQKREESRERRKERRGQSPDEFEAMQRHFMKQEKMIEMARRGIHGNNANNNGANGGGRDGDPNNPDPRQDKLERIMQMKDTFRKSLHKLETIDNAEHQKAEREHIPQMPKDELKLDMQQLKNKAKHKLLTKIEQMGENVGGKMSEMGRAARELSKDWSKDIGDKIGVAEMISNREMQALDRLRGKINTGLNAHLDARGATMRGGGGHYHGEEGMPLPPLGKKIVWGLFGVFGLVGLGRWYADKRRRAHKGRRNL